MAEYLTSVKTPASGVLRGASPSPVTSSDPAHLIRQNVLAMANIFICGMDGKSAFPNLTNLGEGARFTVISWRSGVSDREADECAAKYVETSWISWPRAPVLGKWKSVGCGEPPFVNVSSKFRLCARVSKHVAITAVARERAQRLE